MLLQNWYAELGMCLRCVPFWFLAQPTTVPPPGREWSGPAAGGTRGIISVPKAMSAGSARVSVSRHTARVDLPHLGDLLTSVDPAINLGPILFLSEESEL